jgi:hypothetical protein
MAARGCSGVAVGVIAGVRGAGGGVAETRDVGSGVAETCGVGGGVAEICSEGVSSTGDVQPASRPKTRATIEILSFTLFIRCIIHAQSDLCNPPFSSVQCFLTEQRSRLLFAKRLVL